MPLSINLSRDPFYSNEGATMVMSTGDRDHIVEITPEALQDIASPPISTAGRFVDHLHVFGEIASRKFDLGLFNADGRVQITSADVADGRKA